VQIRWGFVGCYKKEGNPTKLPVPSAEKTLRSLAVSVVWRLIPSVKLCADKCQICTDFRPPLYRFSTAHGISAFDLWGLQWDARSAQERVDGRRRAGPRRVGWRAARRLSLLTTPPCGGSRRGYSRAMWAALCCGGAPARPCRRPGRPPQAEGLPHPKKVLTRGRIRSKVLADGEAVIPSTSGAYGRSCVVCGFERRLYDKDLV
jgi:hypothetical protein